MKRFLGSLIRTFGGFSRPIVLGIVVTINLVHPMLHQFEGGGLDAFLVYLDGFVLAVDPYLPAVKR